MEFPFKEEILCDRVSIRVFDQSIDESELVWHRDREDRIVEPMHDTDWMLQMDNELPVKIREKIFIPKESYHRIIKGTGSVAVRVTKL